MNKDHPAHPANLFKEIIEPAKEGYEFPDHTEAKAVHDTLLANGWTVEDHDVDCDREDFVFFTTSSYEHPDLKGTLLLCHQMDFEPEDIFSCTALSEAISMTIEDA